MKIVCDACQAKYSISDDKVQGKVFKIRCKKCSNIIVVRGGSAEVAVPAPAAAQEKDTRVYDYGYDGANQAPAADDAVWHVVINQDQVGPMTAQEVQQRFAAGEIDGETYAWREGFADWIPLAQVDVFAELVASGSTTTAVPPGGGGAAAVAAMFGSSADEAGTTRSDPGDLFAAASSSARRTADDDGGDLFGSRPAAEPAAASAAANTKLRGERNENSVLFSLNNLAQLASDKPAAAATSTMPGHATGAAGGEGSGLIDIRSMANAYLGQPGGASKPAAASAIGSIDDLPVFGGGGFSEPAVIVPTVRSSNNSKLMYALIGSVGLLAVAAVILVIVLLKGGKSDDKGKDDNVTASTEPAKPDDTAKPDEAAAKPADPKPADPPAEPPKTEEPAKPDEAAAKPEPDKKPDEPARKPARTERHSSSHSSSRSSSRERTASTKPKDPPKSSGGCDEVSCVLNNYAGSCCAKYRKGGSKPSSGSTAGNSNLPAGLDRDMIARGLGPVKSRVKSCGAKSSKTGIVKVNVKVSASGSVSSVRVTSSPDKALGSCVGSVVRGAHFAKTQRGGSFNWAAVF